MNNSTRYSDQKLLEFKEIIEKKLVKSRLELGSLSEQITELGEKMSDDRSDFVDSTNSQSEGEMLRTMLHRVQKYHRELENAMTRINNKSYGICSITNELIDERRLRAVPTTTKSLAVKLKPPVGRKRDLVKRTGKKIIAKVLKPFRKKGKTPPIVLNDEEEQDWESDDVKLNEADLKAMKEEFSDGAGEEVTGLLNKKVKGGA